MNATSYEIYLKRGPTPGMVYPLTEKGLTIGRDPLSDILINDPEVSRQHALLSRAATGDFLIQDLGSTNGTYVDGKRLGSEPITLQPSNAITMGGSVTLIFRERSQSGQSSPGQIGATASPKTIQGTAKDKQPGKKAGKQRADSVKERPKVASQVAPSDRKQDQPLVYSSGEEIPMPSQIETGVSRELSPNLILGLVLLLLCACASILVFLLYLGGDWFFREIGLVP